MNLNTAPESGALLCLKNEEYQSVVQTCQESTASVFKAPTLTKLGQSGCQAK